MTSPRALAALLAAVMTVQSVLGLLFRGQYRDADWIKATWLGNDWVTLLLAVPLLSVGIARDRRESVRGRLLLLGGLGYGAYNYAFYLFGAALNAFFPLYVFAFVLSVAGLIFGLIRTRARDVARRFAIGTPVRAIGGYLVFVACGLATVWIVMWAAYVFAGRPTPVEPEAFKLVAALDLSLMVPSLLSGGILLWRKRPWGYVIAAVAGIQGALYLVVLSANSAIAIARGLVQAPGELPMWGPLALGTTGAAATLLAAARGPAPLRFENVTAILPVRSLAASIEYYARALGFAVDWQDPGIIASVGRDGAHVWLCEGDQGHSGTWVWFGVSDAKRFFKECVARDVAIRVPPTNYPWALEFQALDPDGNVLRFGSDPLEGEPTGAWRDMRGDEWVQTPGGGWTRRRQG